MCIKTISINEIKGYKGINDTESIIIDLRSEADYKTGHISGAVNIPYDEFDKFRWLIKDYKNIMLYCEFGSMSIKLAKRLSNEGIRVINLYGGIASFKGYLVQE